MKIMVLIPFSRFSRNVARDLIYGCWCKGKRIGGIRFPPISQLLVATFLKKAGHEVNLFDMTTQKRGFANLRQEILNNYRCVIILTSTMTLKEDTDILAELKEINKNLKTVLFGAHPTFMPHATLGYRGVDFIIRGEAEYIIRDLVNALDKDGLSWKAVAGLGYQDKGSIILNAPYPFIENLDELPIPDRTMLTANTDYFNPVVKRMPYTTVFTSRGCPGRCVFCSSPAFYGRTIRFRSARSVLEELEIIQKLGYKEVFFRDEIFTVSKERTLEICEGILEKKIDLAWVCSARVDSVDKETMRLMKRAGCHLIRFGVESGAQEILDNIKKDISIEQTWNTFSWAEEIGIDTHAHLMVGMPGETQGTIEKTILFAKELNPTIVTFGICTPYPGTELFDRVKEKYPRIGDGSSCNLSYLHTRGFYNKVFTALSDEALAKNIRRAYRSFYLRPTYILKWLSRFDTLNECQRVSLAATQVLDFIFRGDSAKDSQNVE